MLGKPIESGDYLGFAIIAIAIGNILIARFATLLKPGRGVPPPSPETLDRLTRHMRASMTLCGIGLGLGGVIMLAHGRVPEWVSYSLVGLQLLSSVSLFVLLFYHRRQRRLAA
jgi:hypothetical protein